MDHIARRLVLIGAVSIGLLALAACGGGQPATPTESASSGAADSTPSSIPLVSVRGAEYSFGATQFTVAAGRITLRFTNEGQGLHELQVMQFNEGVLIHQFMGALHQGEGLEAALGLVSPVGGVGPIGPGQTGEATVDLQAGEYLLISLVRGPDGVPDVVKGMVRPLTVTAAP
jgi:hypothetical protein